MSAFSALAFLAQQLVKQAEGDQPGPLPPATGPATPGGQRPEYPGYKALADAMPEQIRTPGLAQLKSPMSGGLPAGLGAPDNLFSAPRAQNLASQFNAAGEPSQAEYMDSPHGQQWLANMARHGGEAENAYQAPEHPSSDEVLSLQDRLGTSMLGSGESSMADIMPMLEFLQQQNGQQPAQPAEPPLEDPSVSHTPMGGGDPMVSPEAFLQAISQPGAGQAKAGSDNMVTMYEGARRLFNVD